MSCGCYPFFILLVWKVACLSCVRSTQARPVGAGGFVISDKRLGLHERNERLYCLTKSALSVPRMFSRLSPVLSTIPTAGSKACLVDESGPRAVIHPVEPSAASTNGVQSRLAIGQRQPRYGHELSSPSNRKMHTLQMLNLHRPLSYVHGGSTTERTEMVRCSTHGQRDEWPWGRRSLTLVICTVRGAFHSSRCALTLDGVESSRLGRAGCDPRSLALRYSTMGSRVPWTSC